MRSNLELLPVNMRQVQPETLPKNSNFSFCLQNIKLKNNTTKTPNSGQFSYPLPNIVSFLFEKNRLEFRFRSRDFSFNLFPVWQPYCWRFWSAIVPTTYSYFYLPLTLSKRERINVKNRPRYISALKKVVLDISRPKNYRHYFDALYEREIGR